MLLIGLMILLEIGILGLCVFALNILFIYTYPTPIITFTLILIIVVSAYISIANICELFKMIKIRKE